MGSALSFTGSRRLIDRFEQVEVRRIARERDHQNFEKRMRKAIRYFNVFCVVYILVMAIIMYFIFIELPNSDWAYKALILIVAIIFPIVIRGCITLLKRCNSDNYQKEIRILNEERQNALAEVMENESYRDVRDVLDRYGINDQYRGDREILIPIDQNQTI